MTTRRPVRTGHTIVVAAVLALVAVVAAAPAGAMPAGAGSTRGGATPVEALAQAGAQGEPAMTIVDQTAWVRPGERFDVRLQVADPPAGATVDMVVYEEVTSRGAFRDSLDDELGDDIYPVDPVPVTGTGPVDIGFTPSSDAGGLSGRGVYPVEVRLRSADDETLASTVTYLNSLNESPGAPLDVSVLIELGAPPALQPDGSVSLAAEWVDRARQRTEAVQAARDTPVSLAPLPETVDGLAQSGDEGAALVDQLRDLAASQEVVARPYVDIDLASLQDAGLDEEAYLQSDAGANVARSRLAVEPAPGIWLPRATWRPEAAQRAATIGFDRAVLPATAVGNGDGEDIPQQPVRVGDGGPLAMVADPQLAAHLTSTDGVVAAQRFLAELTSLWLEAPSERRGVVVQIPADADVDPDVLTAALTGLADGHAVRAIPVTQAFTEIPAGEDGTASVSLAPAQAGPDLVPVAARVRADRTRVEGAAEVVDDPGAVAALNRTLLMVTGTDVSDGARRRYLASVEATLGGLSAAVTLPEEFRITLTTRTATIPVQLTNNTQADVTVRVELDSDQLEFPDGDVFTETLPPGGTRLEVRVRTRTSGAFTLDVTVSSPDETFVFDRSTFDIRSTVISGVGLLLSAGAVLFLALWWGRHFLRARRARRDGESPQTPPDRWTGPPPGESPRNEPAPTATPASAGPGAGSDAATAPSPARARSTRDLAPWATSPTRPQRQPDPPTRDPAAPQQTERSTSTWGPPAGPVDRRPPAPPPGPGYPGAPGAATDPWYAPPPGRPGGPGAPDIHGSPRGPGAPDIHGAPGGPAASEPHNGHPAHDDGARPPGAVAPDETAPTTRGPRSPSEPYRPAHMARSRGRSASRRS